MSGIRSGKIPILSMEIAEHTSWQRTQSRSLVVNVSTLLAPLGASRQILEAENPALSWIQVRSRHRSATSDLPFKAPTPTG